ncbi:MAG TPA: hypothetical protein VFF40_12655 [Acidimicrobiia bacterium]|nr:hypothetical protein [Acidimicrobiia bacterium]
MFKRVRWMAVGFGAGVGTSVWAYRSVRRTVERRASPELIGAGRKANELRRDLRDAVAEGRAAMHEREAELHTRLANGRDPTEP